MKIISLFSGIGAFEKALKNLNIKYELVAFSEIDKWAITSYCAIHGESEDKNIGDVKNVENFSIYKDIDLITGGSPCFCSGTLITTKNGLKKIEDIIVGDEVLTHKNRFKKVVSTMVNHSNKIYNLKIQGSPITYVTEEHPYYVREMYKVWNSEKGTYDRRFSNPRWKTVKNLKNDDFVGFPINKLRENPFNLTKEDCWLLGSYVASGHLNNKKAKHKRNNYQIVCFIDKSKIGEFKDNAKDYHATYHLNSQSTYKVTIDSQHLANIIQELNLGEGAKDKKIPSEVQNLPIHLIKSFLNGYMGGEHFADNVYKIISTNKELIFSLSQLIAKVYKKYPDISFCKKGKDASQSNIWSISFIKNTREQKDIVLIDDYIWLPFKEKELLNISGKVYNFEVEDDNSYVANNCIVHNCQDFSVAGNRQGSMFKCLDCQNKFNPLTVHHTKRNSCDRCSSNNIEKTRSSLLIEYLRAVREVRPKYFIYENVKGMISKRFIDGFNMFIKELKEYGYNIYYQVLNAKDYGIPQNRERVFVVGVREDIDDKSFKFPEPFDNGLRLRHLLEDYVDEKYYISSERSGKLLEELKKKELEEAELVRQKNQEISYCIDANYYKGTTVKGFLTKSRRQLVAVNNGKVLGEVRACISSGMKRIRQERGRFKENYGPMLTLTATDRHGITKKEHKNEMKVIGNIVPSNHTAGRVFNVNGVSPTVMYRNSKVVQILEDKAKLINVGNLDMKGHEQVKRVYDPSGLSPTISTMQGGHREPKIVEKESNELKYMGSISNKDWAKDGKELSRNSPQGERVYSIKGVACCQSAKGGGTGGVTGLYLEKPKIVVDKSIPPSVAKNFEREKEEILKSDKDIYRCKCTSGWQDNVVGLKLSPTIRAMNNSTSALDNNYRIRKLTPLECWRLMGFEDEDYWTARMALEKKYYNGRDRSNSQMYKQAGNSIVVNVLEEIFSILFKKIESHS